jgi:hypothetical protein
VGKPQQTIADLLPIFATFQFPVKVGDMEEIESEKERMQALAECH